MVENNTLITTKKDDKYSLAKIFVIAIKLSVKNQSAVPIEMIFKSIWTCSYCFPKTFGHGITFASFTWSISSRSLYVFFLTPTILLSLSSLDDCDS